jgi:hypothetical protein
MTSGIWKLDLFLHGRVPPVRQSAPSLAGTRYFLQWVKQEEENEINHSSTRLNISELILTDQSLYGTRRYKKVSSEIPIFISIIKLIKNIVNRF